MVPFCQDAWFPRPPIIIQGHTPALQSMDGSTSLHEQPGSFNCFDTVGQYHADLLASPLSHLHENLPSSPLPSSPPRLGVLDVVFL